MSNLYDRILAVFLDKQAFVLKDSDISQSLIAQGTQCYSEDIRRHVFALSPALFRLVVNHDNSVTIHLEPTIEICGPFLASRCHNKDKLCDRLHLCRDFGHCSMPNCRFPHDFRRGQNRKIVEQMNCADVNPQLLVRLLRMLKPPQTNFYGRATPPKPTPSMPTASKMADLDKQLDLSFPSSSRAPQTDMEIVELVLSQMRCNIEQIVNESENEFFRRVTVQLESAADLERLLQSGISSFRSHDLKCKRSKQLVDRASFVIKAAVHNGKDKLAESRVKLYVSLLVSNTMQFTLIDLSASDEQVFLVQCDNELIFDKVYAQHKLKPTLQEKPLTLIQIYECDTAMIRFNDDQKMMTYEDVESIMQSVRMDIFTYQLTDNHCVEVEFINTDAFKRWMREAATIMAKFRVSITPILSNVEENSDSCSIEVEPAPSIPFSLPTTNVPTPAVTTIRVRPEWAAVAAHPHFQREFCEFITRELGGTLTINGHDISYTGSFPRLPRPTAHEAILANKTNNYMQTLRFQTMYALKTYQVHILHRCSATVVIRRLDGNNFLVAAKPNDMEELRRKLFPKPKPKPDHPSPSEELTNNAPGYIRPTSFRPLLEQTTKERSYSITIPSPTTVAATAVANFTSIYSLPTAEQQSLFSIPNFESRLEQHLTDTYQVKVTFERGASNDKTKNDRSRLAIKIVGAESNVDSAILDVTHLFTALRTRKLDEQTDGSWTKSNEAIDVIQHHLRVENMTCACQRISPTSICLNYFDMTNPQFGVDELMLDDLIKQRFSLATIAYTPESAPPQLVNDWTALAAAVRKRDDYREDICLSHEASSICLFGVSKVVKDIRQEFEKLKTKHTPLPCKLTLSEKQLNYLVTVAQNDLKKLEMQHKTEGCDLSLTRLQQQREFIAPADMHATIKAELDALTNIAEMTFEIQNSAFALLVSQQPDCLSSGAKSKCSVQTKTRAQRIDIPVPKARGADLEALAKPTQRVSASIATSIPVGRSTISILTGDLTTQAVDVIVVCWTSEYMRKAVLTAAGPQVQAEVTDQSNQATSNGALPCKRILFLSWQTNASNPHLLKPSLGLFIRSAINYVVQNGYQTIAFPSVGCGKLGFDPAIIAQHMIDETQAQLLKMGNQLHVSFVLLADQKNVYDEFVKYLNASKSSSASASIAPTTSNGLTKMSYDEKVTEVTLNSTSQLHLLDCKKRILELAETTRFTKHLTDKADMLDWSQATLNQFYTTCLSYDVKPTLDLDNLTVELVGPKDAVHEAEKHFFELTTETFKQARNNAVSQGVIWSFQAIAVLDLWEQYSFKLNGLIEDAYRKKQAHVDFVNDRQERCRLVFASSEEQHGPDVRKVRRQIVDSSLPDIWDPSDKSCTRVPLGSSSKEYQKVLQQFNTTMVGKYSRVVKIERIQNERWYKQYAAHRDEYKKRDGNLDERLLFHGCTKASSEQIIQECFNRSFAGVNGVAYGCGVYFHAHASYSHNYAKVGTSGERTMFLARVLIGRTCRGDQTMKTPPTGYDTTSDGQHIFVVYHDAAAYADHLITYQ